MIKWNEVTWYSRLGAIILFVGVVPVLSFYIGTQYAFVKVDQLQIRQNPVSSTPIATESQISSSDDLNIRGALSRPIDLSSLPQVEHWGGCKNGLPTKLSANFFNGDTGNIKYALGQLDSGLTRVVLPLVGYKVSGYCLSYPPAWSVHPVGVESINLEFNFENASGTTQQLLVQVAQSGDLTLENADKTVYSYEHASSPLVEAEELEVSRKVEEGEINILTLITTKGDILYTRYFLIHAGAVYVFRASTSLGQAKTAEYIEFLNLVKNAVKSMKFVF